MTSVYKILQKIKCLSDKRKRRYIPLFNTVMPVLLFLMLQYESFHTFFSAPESMSKRMKNCISGKIPKVDAVRDLLSGINPEEVRKIHEETVDTVVGAILGKSNFVKRCNRMDVTPNRSQHQIKNSDILLSYIGML